MRVLHISGAKVWGGNEQQLIYLIDELPRFNIRQVLFCFKDTPLHREATAHPVKICSIDRVKPFSAAYFKALRRIIKEEEIDLIHLHTSDSVTGYVITDIIKPLNTPTVFTKKGIRKKNSWLSKYKYNSKSIDRIICVSESVKENFAAILRPENRKKLVVVNDGVKINEQAEAPYLLREKLGISAESFIFGSIANHTKAKDLHTLIRALKKLKILQPKKKFYLVQIGKFSKLTPEIMEEVEKSKLNDVMSFLGFVPQASAFLKQFDSFVISSSREGGPSTLMEAFAVGTPVVSTKVGVINEAIENGKNGFYTAPGNAHALAEKMAAIMEDGELRQKFSELSKEVFRKKFTVEHLAQETYFIYKDLVQE